MCGRAGGTGRQRAAGRRPMVRARRPVRAGPVRPLGAGPPSRGALGAPRAPGATLATARSPTRARRQGRLASGLPDRRGRASPPSTDARYPVQYVQYRGGVGMLAWAFHRVSGVGVWLFILLHVFDIWLVGGNPELYDEILRSTRARSDGGGGAARRGAPVPRAQRPAHHHHRLLAGDDRPPPPAVVRRAGSSSSSSGMPGALSPARRPARGRGAPRMSAGVLDGSRRRRGERARRAAASRSSSGT